MTGSDTSLRDGQRLAEDNGGPVRGMTTQVHNQSLLEPAARGIGRVRGLVNGKTTDSHAIIADDDDCA
jgi:hypothetical protein